jgi:ankyrin repeat protein
MGHTSAVKVLLENGADINSIDAVGKTSLDWACGQGHGSVVKLLIESGADVNCAKNDILMTGYTPLHWACAEEIHFQWTFENKGCRQEPAVKMLLESGADINKTDYRGRTPLHLACEKGHKLVVKLLLEKGADVMGTDEKGQTPLHWACEGGEESVVKMLLENGADIDAIGDKGKTPLNVAVHRAHHKAAKVLIKKGADVNISNKKGRKGTSPLHTACKLVEPFLRGMVPMLILAGADTQARDYRGRLPIDLIEDDKCRRIFKKAEAKLESQALKPVFK